jgi:hypothetical protein
MAEGKRSGSGFGVHTRVSSLSLVRYKNNDYSAPARYGHQEVLAKGYVDRRSKPEAPLRESEWSGARRFEIVRRDATIAVHPRRCETADFIYNPLHYLALLEQKTKAPDQAAPLDNWRLADCVHRLRRLMEARMETAGRREFIQVLRLMENFHQHQVEQAVSEALRHGAISFDAVKCCCWPDWKTGSRGSIRHSIHICRLQPSGHLIHAPILASSPAKTPFL